MMNIQNIEGHVKFVFLLLFTAFAYNGKVISHCPLRTKPNAQQEIQTLIANFDYNSTTLD